jgi:hypothetical protein
MKASLFLSAVLALGFPAEAGVPSGRALEGALRGRFLPEEQWLLDAVLSDSARREAFVSEGKSAREGGEAGMKDFEMRWRKKTVELASEFREHVRTHDVVPNAQTIETMVDAYEQRMMNHWIRFQPDEKRRKILSDTRYGNYALKIPFSRQILENQVRGARKDGVLEIDRYLELPSSKEAKAYSPPPKETAASRAAAAVEQASRAAEQSGAAERSPSGEGAAGLAGASFTGGAAEAVPVEAREEPVGEDAGLKRPPAAVDKKKAVEVPEPRAKEPSRDKEPAVGVGWTLGLVAAGTGLGLLLGGPVGAAGGALAAAAACLIADLMFWPPPS